MGNWGTYHKKACKGGSYPVAGGGTTEKCGCQGSVSDSSTSAILYLHNTTITNTDGLKAIATIKVTKGNGRDYNGQIDTITKATLTNSDPGGNLQTNTQLQVDEILNLSGTGTGTSSEVTIDGTIIVTSTGSLGETITLTGLLAGTLNLSNSLGGINTIDVTKGTGNTLTAKAPADLNLGGINITISGLSGNGSMTISTTKDTDDLTTLADNVTIKVTKLTKGKVADLADGSELTTGTQLKSGDTINLEGTANANSGNIKNLKVTGTITITGGSGNLESGLSFSGNLPSDQFQDADDGVTVTGNDTITLSDKLNALKNTNFSLTSDGNRALTYCPELVTKSKITVGTKTSTTGKATISGPSLVPVCITITSNGGLEGNITDVTFAQSNATTIKEPEGQTINLSTLNNSTVTITKDKVASLAGADKLDTSTTLKPNDTLTLNIEGSGTTKLESKITVTKSGTFGTNPTLSGGLTANITNLNGNGTLTGTVVTITNPKYDPDEFHVNHQSTLCCYWGGKVFEWSDRNHNNEPWHIPVVLGPFQICLAVVLVYLIHYRDSSISRAIINQPKMSTALSIIFYMCSEILLAGSKVLPLPLLPLVYSSVPLIPPDRVRLLLPESRVRLSLGTSPPLLSRLVPGARFKLSSVGLL